MPVKPVTKEEILDDNHNNTGDYGGEDYVMRKVALRSMDSWAALQTAERGERIKQLEAIIEKHFLSEFTEDDFKIFSNKL